MPGILKILPSFLAVIAAGSLFATTALAQPAESKRLEVYERGPSADQLEADITPVPAGMGAIFVPSATVPKLEPSVSVNFKGDRVAWGLTGERIVVPPGEYEVVLGHGDESQRARTDVRVVAGVTTMTKPFFAALRVTAVDDEGERVPTDYTLEDLSGQNILSAQTTTGRRYADTKTWILPVGRVTVALDNGDKYSRNAVELDLAPGQIARYRMVVAAGRLTRAELADREIVTPKRAWRTRWVIGGDASFSRTAGQLGSFNGDYLRAGVFTHAELGYDRGQHLALLTVDVDQSWIGLGNEPGQDLTTQKFSDEVQAELVYNFRLGGIVGPYVRGRVRTSLFDTAFTPTQDTLVRIENNDGSLVRVRNIDAGDQLKLFDSFEPLELRAGTGLSVSAVDTQVVNVRIFGGAGYRHATFGDGLFVESVKGDQVEAVVLKDDDSFGSEVGLRAGLRLSQAFSLDITADVFTPSGQMFDGDTFNPIFRLDNRATFSVNRFLAVVYNNRIGKQAYEINDAQVSHMMSVRLQHTLF